MPTAPLRFLWLQWKACLASSLGRRTTPPATTPSATTLPTTLTGTRSGCLLSRCSPALLSPCPLVLLSPVSLCPCPLVLLSLCLFLRMFTVDCGSVPCHPVSLFLFAHARGRLWELFFSCVVIVCDTLRYTFTSHLAREQLFELQKFTSTSWQSMPFQPLPPHLRPNFKPVDRRPSVPKAASMTLLPLASRSGGCATAAVPGHPQRLTSTTKVRRTTKLKVKRRIGFHARKPKLDSRQTNLDTFLHGNAVTQSCSTSDAAACQNRDAVSDCNLLEICDGAAPPPCYDSYIEKLTNDIDSGVFDLRGCPWVHPSEPYMEVMKLNSLRHAAGKALLDSREVRDVVFRPLVHMAAAGPS